MSVEFLGSLSNNFCCAHWVGHGYPINLSEQFIPLEKYKKVTTVGWSPRTFKNFDFKPKLSFFRENHENDHWGEFSDFYEFTLCMIFKIFHENSHYRNGHFQENRENHIKGEFVKIRKFTLVIIVMISPQKWQFGLKIGNFVISQNTA